VTIPPWACRSCGHPFYEHRESTEWQLLNPRRKRNLTGCTHSGCSCTAADESHVRGAHPASPVVAAVTAPAAAAAAMTDATLAERLRLAAEDRQYRNTAEGVAVLVEAARRLSLDMEMEGT
jgi:hypothetical protein